MYRRRYVRARRSRRAARQTGFKSFSSRVGSGFPQGRLTRTPRVERMKFLDLDWTHPTDVNYYQCQPLICSRVDHSLNNTIQGDPSKRCLNLVKNGSGNNDRTGARIMMKSLLIRGTIYYSPIVNSGVTSREPGGSTTTAGTNTAIPLSIEEIDRSVTLFVVYYPRLFITQMPTWSSLLEAPISTNALQDETNILGARILLRKSYRLSLEPLGPQGGVPFFALGKNSRRDIAWKINLNLPAEWDNAPTTDPSFTSLKFGHLHIFALSNTFGPVNSPGDPRSAAMPYVSLRARMAFVDA